MRALLDTWRIDTAPLIPLETLWVLAGFATLVFILSLFFYRRAALWRGLCAVLLIGALFNPSFVEEQRTPVKDVAVMVIDDSPSQSFGQRRDITAKTQAAIEQTLAALPDIDVRIVRAPDTAENSRQTELFAAIRRAYGDTPSSRRAGVVMITDGQVHDIPPQINPEDTGPLHVLLSGEKDEQDRQLVITQAPGYGIVGQNVSMRFKVEDSGQTAGQTATVIIRRDQGDSEVVDVTVGEEHEISLPIDHGGKNIFEFESAPQPDELTEINNKAAVVINGVRDRLRVLLVSGRPHMGGRTWRNLLTGDPAVDLVHFTILRDPEKLDMTPQHELSLIPFPFHEFFDFMLNEFDLIIFDRYSLNKILPPYYFDNIARYIEEGGALLEASGPEYATGSSLFETALGPILPGRPAGSVIERPFRPALTDTGRRHPVTEDLQAQEDTWGAWLRQVDLRPANDSDVLMTGDGKAPLLMLGHVGEGRIAQLASDQIWLWSRGYDGGGPQAQLLRRLAHWLMKEPELEEEMLEMIGDASTLLVRRRSLDDQQTTVTLTHPDGTRQDIALEKTDNSPFFQKRIDAPVPGVYAASDGTLKTLAVVGDLSAPEYKTLLTSAQPLTPAVTQSGGSIRWANEGVPTLRQIPPGRNFSGRGWIGLKKNNDYVVTGIKALPLLPVWVMLALLAGSAVWSWWRESRA